MQTRTLSSAMPLGVIASLGSSLLSCVDPNPPESTEPAEVTGERVQALECEVATTPLTPEYCTQLDAAGTVNVMCPWDPVAKIYTLTPAGGGAPLYAHPDDDCDDFAALQAALLRAGQRKTVYLPAGTLDLSGAPYASSPYLTSQPLDVSFRRVVGEAHSIADVDSHPNFSGGDASDDGNGWRPHRHSNPRQI